MATFRNAYVQLVNIAQPREGAMLVMELGPGSNHSGWQAKRAEVAAAAGPASVAYVRHGGLLTLRNVAYVMRDVDPVLNWELSFRDPDQLPPDRLVATVEAAISRAAQEAQEAAQRERGLTGLIAAFIRWPSDLREAVGPGHPGQRRAAGVVGVFGQLVVATVAGALSLGLAAVAVKAWEALTG